MTLTNIYIFNGIVMWLSSITCMTLPVYFSAFILLVNVTCGLLVEQKYDFSIKQLLSFIN